mmetsp:Transcript_1779/g.3966  ORF Transcript_1779/g.3966 Transcript_1779/m.3966 type:complete len:315 (+) Transcript_1779:308-1252(+)
MTVREHIADRILPVLQPQSPAHPLVVHHHPQRRRRHAVHEAVRRRHRQRRTHDDEQIAPRQVQGRLDVEFPRHAPPKEDDGRLHVRTATRLADDGRGLPRRLRVLAAYVLDIRPHPLAELVEVHLGAAVLAGRRAHGAVDVDHHLTGEVGALRLEAVDVLRVQPRELAQFGMQEFHDAVGERRLPLLLVRSQYEAPFQFQHGKGILQKHDLVQRQRGIILDQCPLQFARRQQLRSQRIVQSHPRRSKVGYTARHRHAGPGQHHDRSTLRRLEEVGHPPREGRGSVGKRRWKFGRRRCEPLSCRVGGIERRLVAR